MHPERVETLVHRHFVDTDRSVLSAQVKSAELFGVKGVILVSKHPEKEARPWHNASTTWAKHVTIPSVTVSVPVGESLSLWASEGARASMRGSVGLQVNDPSGVVGEGFHPKYGNYGDDSW